MILAEPWYDYLAFPLAPIVVLVQAGALFLRQQRLRVSAAAACFGAVMLMTAYLANRPTEYDDGVDLGFIIVLWYVLSMVLLGVAAIREIVVFVARRRR